jgi:aprataxin
LCGESGAGKSTLSAKLVATGRWAAANQDTISNGKRGSRQQCIRAAKRALEEGKHVVIDRCGLSVQQREDFVALAKTATPPCALHSIWFNQPISVYAKRAAARVNHPGGVQGEFALRVVQRQHRQKDNAPPTKDEGFVVVRRCKFQDQVDAATVVYKNLPAANISCVFPKPVRSAKKSADEVEDEDEDMVDDGDDDDFGSG